MHVFWLGTYHARIFAVTPFDQRIPPPVDSKETHRDDSVGFIIIITEIVASLSDLARLAQKLGSKNLGADDFAIIPAVVPHILDSLKPKLNHRSHSTLDGRRWQYSSIFTPVSVNPSAITPTVIL